MHNNRPEIRLHIGFHKTATTHFQDMLSLVKDELIAKNVSFLPRETYRKEFTKLSHYSVLEKYKFQFFKYRKLKSTLLKESSRLVLASEENILGNLAHIMDVNPLEKTDLDFINILNKYHEVKIYLSIRPFGEIYSSAYCSLLKYSPGVALATKQKLLNQIASGNLPCWLDIIKNLQSRLPNANFKVWEYRHYREHLFDIIGEFTDGAVTELPVISAPEDTKSPNGSAISIVEKMIINNEYLDKPVWLKKVSEIYSEYAVKDNSEKYNLLSGSINEFLNEAYTKEIGLVDNLPRLSLMDFKS